MQINMIVPIARVINDILQSKTSWSCGESSFKKFLKPTLKKKTICMETDKQLSENTTINIILMKEILCFINNSLIAIIKENITPEKQKNSKIYRNTCNKLFLVFVYQIVVTYF